MLGDSRSSTLSAGRGRRAVPTPLTGQNKCETKAQTAQPEGERRAAGGDSASKASSSQQISSSAYPVHESERSSAAAVGSTPRERCRGIVKSYQPEKAFGFLICPGKPDIFLHQSHIIGPAPGAIPLDGSAKGPEMEFELDTDPKGRPRALNARLVEGSPAAGVVPAAGASGGELQRAAAEFHRVLPDDAPQVVRAYVEALARA